MWNNLKIEKMGCNPYSSLNLRLIQLFDRVRSLLHCSTVTIAVPSSVLPSQSHPILLGHNVVCQHFLHYHLPQSKTRIWSARRVSD